MTENDVLFLCPNFNVSRDRDYRCGRRPLGNSGRDHNLESEIQNV
jgi:hypothetical protein